MSRENTIEMTNRHISDEIDILTHGRKINEAELRCPDVIKASHGNVVGHPSTATTQFQQRPYSGAIVIEQENLR